MRLSHSINVFFFPVSHHFYMTFLAGDLSKHSLIPVRNRFITVYTSQELKKWRVKRFVAIYQFLFEEVRMHALQNREWLRGNVTQTNGCRMRIRNATDSNSERINRKVFLFVVCLPFPRRKKFQFHKHKKKRVWTWHENRQPASPWDSITVYRQ